MNKPFKMLSLPQEINFPIWKVGDRHWAFIYVGEIKFKVLIDIYYNFETWSLVGRFQMEKRWMDKIFHHPNPKIRVDGFSITSFVIKYVIPGKSSSKIADVEIFIHELRTSKDASVDSMVFPIINSKRFRGDLKISDNDYTYSNGRSRSQIGSYEICTDNTRESKMHESIDYNDIKFEISSIIEIKSNKIARASQISALIDSFGWAYSFAAGSPAHIGITWGIKNSDVVYFSIRCVALDKKSDVLNWATWLDGSDIINLVSKVMQISDKKRKRTMKIIMSIYYNMKGNNILSRNIIDLAIICEVISKVEFRGEKLNIALRNIVNTYKIETEMPKSYQHLQSYVHYMRLNRPKEIHYWKDVPSTFAGIRNMMVHGEFAEIFVGPPNANAAIHQLDTLAEYYAQLIILNYIGYSGNIYDLMSNIESGTSGFKKIN